MVDKRILQRFREGVGEPRADRLRFPRWPGGFDLNRRLLDPAGARRRSVLPVVRKAGAAIVWEKNRDLVGERPLEYVQARISRQKLLAALLRERAFQEAIVNLERHVRDGRLEGGEAERAARVLCSHFTGVIMRLALSDQSALARLALGLAGDRRARKKRGKKAPGISEVLGTNLFSQGSYIVPEGGREVEFRFQSGHCSVQVRPARLLEKID